MLFPVMKRGSLPLQREAYGIWRCDTASVMDDLRARIKHYLPTLLPSAPTPIDIISVHEQLFVKQADIFKSLTPYHREAAHDYLNGQWPLVKKAIQILTGKEFGVPEPTR